MLASSCLSQYLAARLTQLQHCLLSLGVPALEGRKALQGGLGSGWRTSTCDMAADRNQKPNLANSASRPPTTSCMVGGSSPI